MDNIHEWIPDDKFGKHWVQLYGNQQQFIRLLIDSASNNVPATDREIMSALRLKPLTLHFWLLQSAFRYCYDELSKVISNSYIAELTSKRARAKHRAWSVINEALNSEDNTRADSAAGKVLSYEKAEITHNISLEAKQPIQIEIIEHDKLSDNNTAKPDNNHEQNTAISTGG